jgi:hypothetical protein
MTVKIQVYEKEAGLVNYVFVNNLSENMSLILDFNFDPIGGVDYGFIYQNVYVVKH